jgi:uncharacterized membrane protein
MTDATTQQIDLRPGADADTNAKTLTTIVYGLYLAGFLTAGLTTIAGVIMAYVAKGSAPAWAQSHYSFQIRTFWIALAAIALMIPLIILMIPVIVVWFVAGVILSILGIGLLMLLALALIPAVPFIWFAVRCAMGLNYALQGQPYPRPTALLA